MTIYFILYFIILIYPKLLRYVSLNEKTYKRRLIRGLFTPVVLLLALRHPRMGADLGYGSPFGYLGSFRTIAGIPFFDVIRIKSFLNYERGYIVFNKMISYISEDPQFLLICCAIVSTIPIAHLISKYSCDYRFSIIVYLGLPAFLLNFSGLRQSIAIGLCCFSVPFLVDKKALKFMLCIAFASLFHYTAFLFILAYPMYHLKTKQSTRIYMAAIPLIIYLIKKPLFLFLAHIVKSEFSLEQTGALTLFVVFVFIYLFCAVFAQDEDIESTGFLNVFILACVCQAFGSIHSLAMRAGYYYMLPLVLALPNIVHRINSRNSMLISFYLVQGVFLIYGLYSFSKPGWAMTNPYFFYWSDIWNLS